MCRSDPEILPMRTQARLAKRLEKATKQPATAERNHTKDANKANPVKVTGGQVELAENRRAAAQPNASR